MSTVCRLALLLLSLAFALTARAAPAEPETISDLVPERAQPSRWPSPLHVSGNQILRADGTAIWLQGVNVVSLEFRVGGEHVLRAAQVAVDEWKSNIVRLPVQEEYWFGRHPSQKDGGLVYRSLVDATINVIANRGAYVLLDLHRFRAPRPAHVEFWADAAQRYQNHPALLFDIFNEPHSISWEVWRDGGYVPKKEGIAEEDGFLSEEEKVKQGRGYHSPGMQKLVDAIRGAGAKNVIVAGGLDWAFDLTGVAHGFALDDRGGSGIVYSTHIYPWKSGWAEKVLVIADRYPILVGEVGCDVKKMSFLPSERQEDPYTWAPDMIGFIQAHRLHWTAFSFHPRATPVMLADWNFTPTPFWGVFVKEALAGKKFPVGRSR